MKKAYKELRKNLKNKFKNTMTPYGLRGGIIEWVNQSGITCNFKHVEILFKVNDGLGFYPYQKKDRKKILKYLKKNKKFMV